MFDWFLKRLGKGKDKDKIRKSAVDKIEETIRGLVRKEKKYGRRLASAKEAITAATAINDTNGSARALADTLFYEEQLVSVAAYIHCLRKQLCSLESSENSEPLLKALKVAAKDEDKYKGKLAKAEDDITKATAINDTTGSARALADKLFYEEQLVSVAAYIHCLRKQLRSLESSENSQPLLKALKVSAKANKRLL